MNRVPFLTTLNQLLNKHFSLEEIRTLCLNLQIDYESVPGEEKQAQIRELLLGLGRRNRLSDLISLLQQERPRVDWPLVPDDFQLPESLATETAVPANQYHVYGDIVQGDKFNGDKVAGDKITVSDVDGNVHIGDIYNYQTSSVQETKPSPPLMMAPEPPNEFVQRPKEYERLINCLLTGAKKIGNRITTIKGAGGVGKTTLAQAICHNERIRNAFADGILWVELGPDPVVLDKLRVLYKKLAPGSIKPYDDDDAIYKLADKLSNRQCLIVIDDVWDSGNLRSFLQIGQNCVYLITTRRSDIAIEITPSPVTLDEMTSEEATKLLLQWTHQKPNDAIPFQQLAQRLGQWPLVLELTGRQLSRCMEMGYTVEQALKWVNDALDREGFTAFDTSRYGDEQRNAAIAKSINISLDMLDQVNAGLKDYFRQLVVFPNTVDTGGIPLQSISALWGFDEYETRKSVHLMNDFSLLKFSGQEEVARLHYVIFQYLIFQLDNNAEAVLHHKLLNGYNPNGNSWHDVVNIASDCDYLQNHLIYHLERAKRIEDIHKLFESEDWAKLRTTEGLLSDFGYARQIALKTNTNIAIRIRYALFNEIVQQRYQNIPVEALSSLISNRTIAPTLLMSAMHTMRGDNAAKTRAYLEVVSKPDLLDDALQEEYAPYILKIAQGVGEAESKATLTIELAILLPDQFKQEAHRMAWQAIFEIEAEEKETRKALLNELWLLLSEAERQQLQEDALTIEDARQRIRVVYQIAQLLGERQNNLWRETISSVVTEDHSNHYGVDTFATLVKLTPTALQPMLRQEAGEAIWQALSARTYWTGGPGNYFDFLEDVLEVLVPYIPKEHIYDAWRRAKWHNESFVAEWSTVTVASSPHFPEELIPALEEKMNSMSQAQYRAKFILASRLPANEREDALLEAWFTAVNGDPRISEMEKLAKSLPETVAWKIWQEQPSLLNAWTPRRTIPSISVLVPYIPIEKIPEAYLNCFQFKIKGWYGPKDRAEIIKGLIERLPIEQQKTQWDKIFTDAFRKSLPLDEEYSPPNRQLRFAIEITKQIPEVWRQEKWPIIVQKIHTIEDNEEKARLLTDIVFYLPVQTQTQTWLEAWNLAATADRKYIWRLQGISHNLLMHLPQIYHHNSSSEEFITQLESIDIDLDVIIDNFGSSDFYHSDVQAGFALLLLYAPRALALKVWEKTKHEYKSSAFQYLWMPILSHLPPEQQEQMLPKMLGRYYESVSEMGAYLIAQWPEEVIKKAWEILCTASGEDMNEQYDDWLTYPHFAHALIPHLPNDYRLDAWQLASKRIKYTDNWPEVCEAVLQSLPDDDVPKAWDDLLAIERENPHFWFSYQLKRAVAPRLPEVETLVQIPEGNALFSETIFTCSLAQYLQKGGLWGVDFQERSDAIIQENWPKFSSIIRILFVLWIYLAYLFVPLLYLTTQFFSGVKKIPGSKKAGGFLKSISIVLFLLTPHKIRMKVWRVIAAPFVAIGTFLSPFQKIASYYALPESQAREKLDKILSSEKEVMQQLVEARPLVQRIGGAKLRHAVSAAYEDAQGWWKDVFKGQPRYLDDFKSRRQS